MIQAKGGNSRKANILSSSDNKMVGTSPRSPPSSAHCHEAHKHDHLVETILPLPPEFIFEHVINP